MGQKVNPYGFRLGVIYPWKSRWYATKHDYQTALHEDIAIRDYIRLHLSRAGISGIDIERKGDQIQVYIRTARPGIVIGRKGSEVERVRKDLERMTAKRVDVKVEDMNQSATESRPETDAQLLAQGVAEQLQGRVSFRRAMRRAVQTATRAGALGVRVQCGGRLGGIEMSRREWYREGRVPAPHAAGEDRLRVRRGQDHLRADRRQGLGVPGRRDPHRGAGDRAGPGASTRRRAAGRPDRGLDRRADHRREADGGDRPGHPSRRPPPHPGPRRRTQPPRGANTGEHRGSQRRAARKQQQ